MSFKDRLLKSLYPATIKEAFLAYFAPLGYWWFWPIVIVATILILYASDLK